MKFSENEAHSANYRSKNELFMRRCRHYKAKESKAEWLGEILSGIKMGYDDGIIH